MTDPTAPPPSPDPGASQPAFPDPVPLTFAPTEAAPPAPAPAPDGTGAAPVPGHWHNPYQADQSGAVHKSPGQPAAGHPTGGWPQVPGYPPPPPGQPYPYGQPYPGHGYGYGAYPYPVARPTNGLAIAAMVTSLIGLATICLYGVPTLILGTLGAILGHVSRRRIRQTGEEGDGMALTGIIVGWVGTGLALLWLAFILFFFLWAVNNPEYSNSYESGSPEGF